MSFVPPAVPAIDEFDFVNHDWAHGVGAVQPFALPAFAAAMVHDMARRHSGFCEQHGIWAVEEKLPERTALFRDWGLDDEGLRQVAYAVRYHCRDDAPEDALAGPVLALLKDADALDRVRFGGPDAIGRHYLHWAHTEATIPFAERLCWVFADPDSWEPLLAFGE
jgi:hypothetical protein